MLKSRMVGMSVLAVGTALSLCTAALASDRGSPEDQLACTPDVYRLCSSFVPDEDAIVACLNRNVHALTPACQKVMTRPSAPAKGGDDQDSD